MLLNTWGLINTWEEPAGGGGGWRKRKKYTREEKKQRKEEKRLKKLVNRYLEGEEYSLGDEKYLATTFLEKLDQGKIEVAGTDVYLEEPIQVPQLPEPVTPIEVLPDTQWQEIALLMKDRAEETYKTEIREYVANMKALEMKLYFMVIALLDEDF